MSLYDEFKELSESLIFERINTYKQIGQEEGQELDFKSGQEIENLFSTNPKAKDHARESLAKDLSAFSNAEGGIIIYGIKEEKIDKTKSRFLDFEPIVKGNFNKESFVQVINTCTSTHLDNFYVKRIDIPNDEEHCLVCILIPETQKGAIQSTKDLKYYKRYETENLPIRHHEIQLINNKLVHPDIVLCFDKAKFSLMKNPSYFRIKIDNLYIKNIGKIIANNVGINQEYKIYKSDEKKWELETKKFEKHDSFFPDFEKELNSFSFTDSLKTLHNLVFEIYADSSQLKKYGVKINLKEINFNHIAFFNQNEYYPLNECNAEIKILDYSKYDVEGFVRKVDI